MGGFLGILGRPGARGVWLALHLDATLMVFNRIRHDRCGSGAAAYAKELSRPCTPVERLLRQCARDRASLAGAGVAV